MYIICNERGGKLVMYDGWDSYIVIVISNWGKKKSGAFKLFILLGK